MFKRNRWMFIALVVGYFLFLVFSRIPASWVAYAVHSAVPSFWLTGVTGTAWNGVARGAQVDIGGASVPMGQFRWQINPWSLLILNPCIAFDSEFDGRPFSGKACHNVFGTLSVSDLSVDVSLGLFSDIAPVPIDGNVSVTVLKAKVAGLKEIKNLDARLAVQQARVSGDNGWMILGSYASNLVENGRNGLKGQVFDIEAPFTVDLTMDWALTADTVAVKGTIAPKPEAPTDAVSAIQIFGEEIERGIYHIQWP